MKVAIIPARGGSRRIPHKNIRLFRGQPIIAYSIEAAQDSGLFDDIFVSTDDENTIDIARTCGAGVIIRPPELAVDEVGTQEVMRDALKWVPAADYACCIYPCAPLMLPEDLKNGFEVLVLSGANYAYAVNADTWEQAGAWYWGKANPFRNAIPLEPYGVRVCIERFRALDINTETDWLEAERRYAILKEVTA